MKTSVILALILLLAGCGSGSVKPDPRMATIRQQHEQLLAMQKEYNAQLSTLSGHEKLSPAHIKQSQGYFADMVAQSQDNLLVLDQLDDSKSQDPDQINLIGEMAAKEAHLLERGTKRLANIHDEHYLPK